MLKKSILLIFAILALQLVFTSCSRPPPKEKEIALRKKHDLRRHVLEMAAKHNADLQWLKILEKPEFYTIELQRALLDPPGRARLLFAIVADVLKREDQYLITAHDWMNDIYFQLQCDAQQAQYILSTSTNGLRMLEEYVIVIQPQTVHKPLAQLVAEMDVDTAYVVHDAADIVVVKGVCLDLLSIGDIPLDAQDLLNPEIVEGP